MANELSHLAPNPGAQRPRTRIGRGQGSGLGKTAGKGTKGQQARTGYTLNVGFEGGQMPLKRRIPKRGFTNIFAKDYTEVNVGQLASFSAGAVVDAEALLSAGVISRIGADGVKVLGGGDLSVALTVRVAKISSSARSKVEAAGGSVASAVVAKEYTDISLGQLSSFAAGSVVDAQALQAAGVVSHVGAHGVKLSGKGKLTVALTVRFARVSRLARTKIQVAGGTVESIA
jgi:large subunit ribosomal protein L15